MRAASLVAPAFATALFAACSGATTSIIDQTGDGGHAGGDGGGHGGGDATTGEDAPSSGGDATAVDTGVVVVPEAGGHETGPACTLTPDSGTACNTLPVPPANVNIVCNQNETVPAPTGGTIQDGRYVMTASTYYAGGTTCPTPEVDGVEWLVCGPTWQLAQSTAMNGQAPQVLVANAAVVQTGANLNITLTCGLTINPVVFGYDATPTTLRLHINGASPNGRIDTFTRQ